MNVSPLSLSSPTYHPQDPSPFNEMHVAAVEIKAAIEEGRWPEAIARIENLYAEATRLGAKAFGKDYDQSCWAVVSELIDILALPTLTFNLSIKRPLAKTLRLYIEIMLWQALTKKPPPKQSFRERISFSKPKNEGLLDENEAETKRETLKSARKSCPSTEISLHSDLDATLQVFKLLPTAHSELAWEYGQFILSTLLGLGLGEADIGTIGEGASLIRKLQDLKIKGWIAETLYLQWVRHVACHNPGPIYEELRAVIEENREKEEIALCAIELYADFIWHASPDCGEKALGELVTFASDHARFLHLSRWRVRYLALTHLKALSAHHLDENVRKRAQTSIENAKTRDKHSQIQTLLTSSDPVWNESLHSVQPTTGPSLEEERSKRQAAIFQSYLISHHVVGDKLIEFVQNNRTLSVIDLSDITDGIDPESFIRAMQEAQALQSLSLKGHPNLSVKELLTVPIVTLTELDLSDHLLTDSDLEQLLGTYPQLQSLTLNGCRKLTGAHLELFKGHTLKLRGIPAKNAMGLKQIIATLKVLDLSESGMPLDVLQQGQKLETLMLSRRALTGNTLASCTSLKELYLEKAHGKLELELELLPSTLTTLSLSHCPNITDAAVNTIIQKAPNLETLYLLETKVTGVEIVGTFPKLRTLHLSYVLGQSPIPSSCDAPPHGCVLVENCPLLDTLVVSGSLFTSTVLSEIVKKTPNLTHLKATGCPPAYQTVIQALIKCPIEEAELEGMLDEIESLNLNHTSFSNGHLFLLERCHRLTHLEVAHTPFSNLGALLRACPHLEKLDINGCPHLLSEGLLDLAGLGELTDTLLQQILNALPEVTHLDLAGAVSLSPNQLIQTIEHCRKITTLNLSEKHLNIPLIQALQKMTSLETLILRGCTGVVASDFAAFAKMPHLKNLVLTDISQDTTSTKLDLSEAPFLNDTMLTLFLRQLPNVQHLVLKNCPLLSTSGLEALAACPASEILDIRGCVGIELQGALEILNTLPAMRVLITSQKVFRKERGAQFALQEVQAPLPQVPAQEREAPPDLSRIYTNYLNRHLSQDALQRDLLSPIPLNAQEERGAPKLLDDAIDEFLKGGKPCCLLMGDAGAGKSLFLKFLEKKLWDESQSPVLTPLLIDLKGIDQRDLIPEAFKKMGYEAFQIEMLKKNQHFLFLLDGYDEMTAQIPVSRLVRGWQGKVLVSCRTQFLARNEGYWKSWFALDRGPEYAYSLLPFKEEQIEAYLDRFVTTEAPWSKEDYLKAIRTVKGLRELVSSPLLLRLVIEALPTLSGQEKIKRVDIYEKFVESWFARARERMSSRIPNLPTLKEMYLFAGKHAHQMIQGGVSVAYEGTVAWESFFSEEAANIRELCPLIDKGKGRYEFFHKTLIEFFAATYLFHSLRMHQDQDTYTQRINTNDVLDHLKDNPLNQKRCPQGKEGEGIEAFLNSEPGVAQFLVDKIAHIPHREERLFAIVSASKHHPELTFAASNALTLLNLCRLPFSGRDLSHIHAPYANLEGALLYRTNLSKADLRGANLAKFQLSYANLMEANLEGAEFGQSPMLIVDHLIDSLACSPNGSRVALGARTPIEIWDWAEAKRLFILDGSLPSAPAFNPSGTILASAGKGNTVRLWNAQDGTLIRTLYGHAEDITHVVFNPDGTELASADSKGTLRRWKVSDGSSIGNPIQMYVGESLYGKCIASLVYHPWLEEIAWGCRDGTLHRYDLITEAPIDSPLQLVPYHMNRDIHLAYSPNGLEIACNLGGRLQRWDTQTGICIEEQFCESVIDDVRCLAYSPDGTLIAFSGADKAIHYWSVAMGSLIGEPLVGHTDMVTDLKFTPDGKEILSSSWDKTLRRWKVQKSPIIPASPSGHTRSVTTAALSPDGKRIVSSGLDLTLRLWDATTGEEVMKLTSQQGMAPNCTFNPDGSEILFTEMNVLKRCDPLTGDLIGEPFEREGMGTVLDILWGVACSPMGDQIASGGFFGNVLRWDPVGNRIGESLECSNGIWGIAYSPDGRFLIAGSQNGRVHGWDARTGELMWEEPLVGHTSDVMCVVFSSLGDEFVSGSGDTTLRRWDTLSGISIEPPFTGHKKGVMSVAYSPDRREIVSGSMDATARIWNVSTAQCVDVLTFHWDGVTSVSWPKQDTLLTGSADCTVALWKFLPIADNTSKWCPVWQSEGRIDPMATHALLKGAHLSRENALLLEQKRQAREGRWT